MQSRHDGTHAERGDICSFGMVGPTHIEGAGSFSVWWGPFVSAVSVWLRAFAGVGCLPVFVSLAFVPGSLFCFGGGGRPYSF